MDASRGQFADHRPDQAQLMTRNNAGAESLWSTFKHEYYYRHTFRTNAELIAAVDNWMYFYNHQRRHSAIGMLAPITYEHKLRAVTEAS
jgi:putative transposase